MKKLILILCFFLSDNTFSKNYQYDLSIVGQFNFADSLGRLSIGLINCLKDDLKINFINVNNSDIILPAHQKDVSKDILNIVNNSQKLPGRVSILLDHCWYKSHIPADYVPDSHIKIAYSLFEATALPEKWVETLNEKFDAIVVPDEFLVDIYLKSGIKKPIFVLPCGMYLNDFFKIPVKIKPKKPFVFGCSASFYLPWKNQQLLIEAFVKEFGNSDDVQLVLHGRFGEITHLKKQIKKLKANNIKLIAKSFNQQRYLAFMSDLDCYVLLSKGEGFSLSPREALASGIPCIITNNSAHKTICGTRLVKSVDANIPVKAYYEAFDGYFGYHYDCKLEDACKALREVYENYSIYLEKAQKARKWVKRYSYKNLKAKYLNLIKPKKVIYGNENIIEDDFIMTNSKSLFDKLNVL